MMKDVKLAKTEKTCMVVNKTDVQIETRSYINEGSMLTNHKHRSWHFSIGRRLQSKRTFFIAEATRIYV